MIKIEEIEVKENKEYSFDNIKILSYEDLLNYVSEEDIMTHYFGEWEPSEFYLCPFKSETKPSFIISYFNESLKWRRFGMYDSPKNPVEFVMIKRRLKFYEALTTIYTEIYLAGLKPMDQSTIDKYRSEAIDEVSMSIRIQDWLDYDLAYWGQYEGFTVDRLELFGVASASELWVNDKKTHISKPEDPLYCYYHGHETGKSSFTAYRPYADSEENVAKRKDYLRHLTYKFRKFLIRNHIINYNTLLKNTPRSEEVFITSSLKDIIALDCIGIDAIAPHSERAIIPEEILRGLSGRYKNIYVAYDNDSTGVSQSLALTGYYKNYSLNYWNVPKGLEKAKDPSDVIKYYGIDILRETIHEKFKRDKGN